MKTIVPALIVSLAIAPPCLAQTSPIIEELIRLEDEWALAVQQADTVALGRIIADDYFGTTASGGLQSKEDYLADFISGDRRTSSLTTEDLRVRVYGETAVLTHGGSAISQYRGTSASGHYRWTHVFVKRDGRWQAVANHVTRLAEQH
jgi:ketosteroid isomerase-like protein